MALLWVDLQLTTCLYSKTKPDTHALLHPAAQALCRQGKERKNSRKGACDLLGQPARETQHVSRR